MGRSHTLRRLWLLAVLAALVSISATTASAHPAGSQWRLFVNTPDDITAGKGVVIQGFVGNVGEVPLSGNLTLTDSFPSGITPVNPEFEGTSFGASCQIVNQDSICDINVDGAVPGAELKFRYTTFVDPAATGTLVNRVTVAGGGMPAMQGDQQSMTVGTLGPFEIERFSVSVPD